MSFNPQEVFSSLQSFLGSGYVLLAVIAMLGVSIVKKLMGILVAGAIIFAIWFFCQDVVVEAWQGILSMIQGGFL